MIYSMTAFARTQKETDAGIIVCEMKSINHRYLELNYFASDVLRVMEMPVREKIKSVIQRGKVDCSLRLQSQGSHSKTSVTINKPLAESLSSAVKEIAGLLTHPAPVDPATILNFPGIIEKNETNLEHLEKEIMHMVSVTLDELVETRKREGQELSKLFIEKLDGIVEELKKVRVRYPVVIQEAKLRLLKRFEEATIQLDLNRLEQEMVLYAQRMDVLEEIERAETHCNEMRRVLKTGGTVGRRLDFLLQELNREANTLGSKSTDMQMTHAAVEMKVLIEQIREQVQNVE